MGVHPARVRNSVVQVSARPRSQRLVRLECCARRRVVLLRSSLAVLDIFQTVWPRWRKFLDCIVCAWWRPADPVCYPTRGARSCARPRVSPRPAVCKIRCGSPTGRPRCRHRSDSDAIATPGGELGPSGREGAAQGSSADGAGNAQRERDKEQTPDCCYATILVVTRHSGRGRCNPEQVFAKPRPPQS